MAIRIKYSIRISILVLYCIYAVSPVYLSAMAGRNDWLTKCGHQGMNVTCGIVWVNVLLSGILPAHQCAQTTPSELTSAEHEPEFILVKKKRAVIRESFQVKRNLVQQIDGPTTDVPPAKALFADNAPRRRSFRCEDLSNFCHGGLSPPLPAA